MSWQDRLNAFIELTSPSGQVFTEAWAGNKRTMDKKLGIFRFPKARGVLVQDLDVDGVLYPLDVHFEGEDHDIRAQRFWNALKERGPWKVLHPTKGYLNLQLVRVDEDIQPVASGNITTFIMDWIEVGIDNPAESVAQLTADIVNQATVVQAAAAEQFDRRVQLKRTFDLARLKAAIARVLAIVDGIKGTIAGVMAQITAIRMAVLGVINATVVSAVSLIGAVQALIVTPGLILRDIKARFRYYNHIIDDAIRSLPGSVDANTAAVLEAVTTSAVVGMALSVVDADITTRAEALGYMEQIEAAFIKVTDALDTIQAQYAGAAADKQYFSQSASFLDMVQLLGMARELLLRRSFDLAAAKTITLQRTTTPMEIALTEGVDLDTLIASNDLHGDDILMLPAGRKVVVYL